VANHFVPADVNLVVAGTQQWSLMDDDALDSVSAVADGDNEHRAAGAVRPGTRSWLAARLRAVLPAADVEDVLQEDVPAAVLGGACGSSAWRVRPVAGWWGSARAAGRPGGCAARAG